MDPNQWNTYNIPPYGHPTSGGLPSVHPPLNRLDLTSAGLSHQLQAGRGVPSLQAVNYQTLSGLPILDTLSPLTSGLSAQGHQLVFNPQTNRISAEPQTPTPNQALSSPHHYENPGAGEALKSPSSRVATESLGRNQLLDAARMWSSSTSFSSPTSLYNQFNAALFPQPVEVSSSHVSAPSGHASISSKSGQNQTQQQQQQHHYLQDPPPAHSSNISASSRLLPVVQRPPEHNQQTGASELLYSSSSSRSTPAVTEPAGQTARPQYSTHKAVVLGVGNSGLVQLQQDIHRQTPVQQQQHHHHQQQHVGFQSQRGGDIQDLSSANSQSNIYGSYANLSSEPQNFTSSTPHHNQQHLTPGDLSYEAVSPAPLQQQRQHHQSESNISGHHHGLSLQLGQFPDLSNLTPEHAHALSEKYQMDSRMQSHQQQQQLIHPDSLGTSSLQRQQGSSTPSQQQQRQGVSSEASRYQGGVTAGSQSLTHILNSGRHTPATQHQSLVASSGSLLSTPAAPSPVQAMADSTTKPKRSRSRKKKGEPAPLPVITPVSQLQQLNSQSVGLPTSNDLNQEEKPNLPLPHLQQQQHLSQPGLSVSSPSPHISTLSMAPTSNLPQSNYARVQTPSIPQSFSTTEQQHHAFQHNSLKPTHQNVAGFNKAPLTYKQPKKSPAKSKVTPSGQLSQQSQAFPQLATNLSQPRNSPMQDGQARTILDYSEQPQHKPGNQIQSSPHVASTGGSYSKLLSQNQILVTDNIGYEHLQQPDHLLDEEEGAVQEQHYHMDFDSQPFMDQLAGMPGPPATSNYGEEVVLATLGSQDEHARIQQQHSGASFVVEGRPTYQGAPVDDIRPVAQYTEHQSGELGMDDVAFGNMFSENHQACLQEELPPAPEPEMTLTFVPHVVEDDELGHFTNPELSEPVTMLPKEQQNNQPRLQSGSDQTSAPAKNSFQNSFLSYLNGQKQETLSSVSSSAVTKKPQLPKYIPEPPRPKPPPPPPSTSNKSGTSKDSSQTLGGAGSSANKPQGEISTLKDSSQKNGGEKEGYSVERTSDLAVKITLPKSKSKNRFGPFAESTLLKDSMQKNRERKRKKGKLSEDFEDDFMLEDFFEEGKQPAQRKRPPPREKTPPPARTSIGRKAKDKCIEMTKKNRDNSDSEDDFGIGKAPFRQKSKSKGYKSDDSIYNSDEDPAWMPFEVDLNQGDVVEKRKKPRRQRVRLPSAPKISKQGVRAGSQVSRAGGSQSGAGTSSNGAGHLKVGTYMIEKKDMQNTETYPIWRVEESNLMRKFDLKADAGRTKHVVTGTFSTWMPSMESQFQTIKVLEVEMKERGGVLAVEVLEEYRPKAQVDAKLDVQYDDDPLVDPFSIYLQVFLSQALEPSFLTVIKETNETFYLDALTSIDGMIEKKCKEITKAARWKVTFQEALHRCPLMKEIDRPNLKQPCQASENPSPPTIKSVFLSGLPYDRFLLTEKSGSGSNNSVEFMIGKVAAHYVRTYHSLYHFKYWLRQRCDAKVKMTKESNKSENLKDETILDKCLENRNWVLQLMDNLKNLLRGGGDAP